MKFKATVLGTAALLAVVAIAAQDAVKVEWKPVVGNKTKYKLDMNASIDMGGQKADMVFGMIQAFETKKIDGDKVTVDTKSSDMTLSLNGQDMSQMMPQNTFTTTVVFTKAGDVLSVTSDVPDSENELRMQNSYAMMYPPKEVKVGDTWTRKVKGDQSKGSVDAEGTYKLEATETVGKWKAAKITYAYKELAGEAPMAISGTMWIGTEDGELVKAELNFKNMPLPQMPPTDAKAKITRLVDKP